jgi:putative addiction module killer protein
MRLVKRFTVREYVDVDGRCPFRDWLLKLAVEVRARIQLRILRFESGNLGDYKSVGAGVFEARFQFGPGYRVYFALDGVKVVLLLVGGDKSSQSSDIRKARQFYAEYQERGRDGAS